ncbi:MAG: periplasmic heavy metal sensor [Ignavibacteriae bacterium]|nr:periplasmic heavy metal sensor [Ignavibacteriota bacterium]
MKKIVFTAAIILTVINLVALSTLLYNRWSGAQPTSRSDRRDQRFEHMKQELALSADQAARLDMSRATFHAELDSLSTQLVAVRKQLAQALFEEKLDTVLVNRRLDNISQLQSDAQRKVISHLLSVKRMLTPEQQKKFHAIVVQRFSSANDQPMPDRPLH